MPLEKPFELCPYQSISEMYVETYDHYEELKCTMIDRYNMLKELKKYNKIKNNIKFVIKNLDII